MLREHYEEEAKYYIKRSEWNYKKNQKILLLLEHSWRSSKDYLEVKMNELFMPYLDNLLRYTRSSSEAVFKLDTKNSLTLYKWMSSWTLANKQSNSRYESLEYLRELLNDGGKYPNFKDFDKRIFKPSIKKIKINGKVWGLIINWNLLIN